MRGNISMEEGPNPPMATPLIACGSLIRRSKRHFTVSWSRYLEK